MEDTRSLLIMVLQQVFENQPKIVENVFQIIHGFNNGKSENRNYEKTLKSICDLMNNQLPSPILVYILTLVDMPQDLDATSRIIEKMRKTHDCLPEKNVRSHLLEHLKGTRTSNNKKIFLNDKVNVESFEKKGSGTEFLKPSKVIKRKRRRRSSATNSLTTESPQDLLDICASFVVQNEKYLKELYQNKQKQTWDLINKKAIWGDSLSVCYKFLNDVNKKLRWLREIEVNDISLQTLMDEYGNSEILYKKNNVEFSDNMFELSKNCELLIQNLIDKR